MPPGKGEEAKTRLRHDLCFSLTAGWPLGDCRAADSTLRSHGMPSSPTTLRGDGDFGRETLKV